MMSVVIDDLNVVSVCVDEAETKPPSVVDPDAVRAFTVASQRLKTVAGRCPQEAQCCSCIQLSKLTLGNSLEVGETPHSIAVGKLFSVLAAETPNHSAYYIAYRDTKF